MSTYKAVLFVALSLLANAGVFSTEKMETPSKNVLKILPEELKWQSNPALPQEIQVAVLLGDPNKNGPLVLRLKIPAGSKIAPHWHPIDENVTVLSGSLNLGHGDKLEQKNSVSLPQGSFASIPAKHHHYAWFTEDTILQLNNFGRWQIFYVNPKDDPRRK